MEDGGGGLGGEKCCVNAALREGVDVRVGWMRSWARNGGEARGGEVRVFRGFLSSFRGFGEVNRGGNRGRSEGQRDRGA